MCGVLSRPFLIAGGFSNQKSKTPKQYYIQKLKLKTYTHVIKINLLSPHTQPSVSAGY